MKYALGLIVLTFNLTAIADSNSVLLLRGRVPASVEVKIEWNNKIPSSRIISNSKSHKELPKVVIEKKTGHYLVSVTHP